MHIYNSIKQGDFISCLLLIIATKALACAIAYKNGIKGAKAKKKTIKTIIYTNNIIVILQNQEKTRIFF